MMGNLLTTQLSSLKNPLRVQVKHHNFNLCLGILFRNMINLMFFVQLHYIFHLKKAQNCYKISWITCLSCHKLKYERLKLLFIKTYIIDTYDIRHIFILCLTKEQVK